MFFLKRRRYCIASLRQIFAKFRWRSQRDWSVEMVDGAVLLRWKSANLINSRVPKQKSPDVPGQNPAILSPHGVAAKSRACLCPNVWPEPYYEQRRLDEYRCPEAFRDLLLVYTSVSSATPSPECLAGHQLVVAGAFCCSLLYVACISNMLPACIAWSISKILRYPSP